MRLPASLKALKYVIKGETFAAAKQVVRDRRMAKQLAVPGLDKALYAAKPKQTAKTLDAWDEKLDAQVAYYKKTGATAQNPQLASKTYIKACRALGIDPVWDRPPEGYASHLTFVIGAPPLHLTKEEIFDKPPLPVGIADDKFFNALRLQRKTVRFADVIEAATAKPPSPKRVRFADDVTEIVAGCLPKARKAADR